MNKSAFSEDEIDRIWEKASTIEGLDSKMFRKDACGAVVMRSKYGVLNSNFGWVIDHIYPVELGGDDSDVNLRLMQWQNAESKGSSFPLYKSVMRFEGFENVADERERRINAKKLAELKEIYNFTL